MKYKYKFRGDIRIFKLVKNARIKRLPNTEKRQEKIIQ